MHSHMHRRHRRLSGIVSLFDLASRAWTSNHATSSLPTSPRLRRDIGLPALEEVPSPCTRLHRKT